MYIVPFRRGGATFAFNAGAQPPFLGDWSSDAYMVYLVLNTTQKLNVAQTLGLNGIRTHDLCDTSAALLPHELSIQLGAGHL